MRSIAAFVLGGIVGYTLRGHGNRVLRSVVKYGIQAQMKIAELSDLVKEDIEDARAEAGAAGEASGAIDAAATETESSDAEQQN